MHDPDVAESGADDARPAQNTPNAASSSAGDVRTSSASVGRSPTGWTVQYVAETGSTNIDLIELARRGAPDRTALRTDHQTAGRGRLDRRWESPPGANLMVSLLFRRLPADPGELTRRVGVAAARAVIATTGRSVVLKWPNDLLVDGRKLAGILAQSEQVLERLPDDATGDRTVDGRIVVVGMGLNTGWSPDGAADLGGAVTPAALLDAVLAEFDDLPAEPAAFHDVYRSMLATLGQQVRVELPIGELVGRVVDVDSGGQLVVIDECAVTHRVAVGDVVHVRPVTTDDPGPEGST